MIEWIYSVPVWWGNLTTQILFALIALAVFAVPRRVFMADAPDQSHWRDVRIWAVVLVIAQLGIYTLFS